MQHRVQEFQGIRMLGLSRLQDRVWVWGDGAGELGSKVLGIGKEDCQSKEVGFEFFFFGDRCSYHRIWD